MSVGSRNKRDRHRSLGSPRAPVDRRSPCPAPVVVIPFPPRGSFRSWGCGWQGGCRTTGLERQERKGDEDDLVGHQGDLDAALGVNVEEVPLEGALSDVPDARGHVSVRRVWPMSKHGK